MSFCRACFGHHGERRPVAKGELPENALFSIGLALANRHLVAKAPAKPQPAAKAAKPFPKVLAKAIRRR
jgi:hypothetical protein